MEQKISFKLFGLVALIVMLLLTSCHEDPTLGGIVWADTDEDGIQDEGEEMVANASVELYDGSNKLVMTTTTNEVGFYQFNKFGYGRFYVKFLLPAGYGFTKYQEGTESEIDSDAKPSSGSTTELYFEDDTIIGHIDAGLIEASPSPPTPTPKPPTVYALANYYEMIEIPEEFRGRIEDLLIQDSKGDYIYSVSSQEITQPLPQTDILDYMLFMVEYDPDNPSPFLPPKLTDCDGQTDAKLRTVCAEGAGPLPKSNILIILMKVSAFVPLNDADRNYIYSLTLDADGNPNNNFKSSLPFDWDFYQNTDRWYELHWEPGANEWKLRVSDIPSGNYNALSQARAFIYADMLGFLVPAEEIPGREPLMLRLSAFAHDGMFTVENASGDVTGANPSEDLAEPLPIILDFQW